MRDFFRVFWRCLKNKWFRIYLEVGQIGLFLDFWFIQSKKNIQETGKMFVLWGFWIKWRELPFVRRHLKVFILFSQLISDFSHPYVDRPLPRPRCVLSLLRFEPCVPREHDRVRLEEAGEEAGRERREADVLNWQREREQWILNNTPSLSCLGNPGAFVQLICLFNFLPNFFWA